MKPLLAHRYEPKRVTFPCYVQPKLNGIRALYQAGHFQSRDDLPFTDGLLDHLAQPLKQIFDDRVILDGELYIHGWPLQRINGAVTPIRLQPNADTLQVQYHIFDRVSYDLSFRDRHELLREKLWLFGNNVFLVPTYQAKNEGDANERYVQFIEAGYEGMMFRLGQCPYTKPNQNQEPQWPLHNPLFCRQNRSKFLSDKHNRTWHLLKRKDWQDDEFECTHVMEGEGKRSNMVGAFACRSKRGPSFSVGSFLGFNDSDLIHYFHNPPIGRKLKIKYLCLSSGGIPLNPTLLAIL